MQQQLPGNIQKLIDIYTKAQENLVKTIAEKEAKGNIATYQKSLLNQVMKILKDLDDAAKQWSQDIIPYYYQQGVDQAIQGLKDLGQDVNMNTDFNQIHKGAIQAIVNSCYGDLNEATNYVGRRIQDTIRQAGIDAVTNKIATGQTVQECKKNIVNSLINEGINGIKDKRGRNISLDAYASTVARSTTREATNTATKNQLTSLGYDLVKMSSHLTTCALCSMFQGRVYSISGQNSHYPPLDTAFSGDHANIHPNCRHVLTPYIPELADDANKDMEYSNRPFDIAEKDKATIDAYNKQQKEKRQLREDRNQYQRYKLALPDDTPKSFANFRQMKSANSEKWQQLQSDYKSIMSTQHDIFIPKSLGAAAAKIYVKNDIPNIKGTDFSIKQGTYITNVEIIAGKGVKREIDDINRLVNQYPKQNNVKTLDSDWQKVKGVAIIDIDNGKKAEVHWYQCKDIGKVEFKIKRWLE